MKPITEEQKQTLIAACEEEISRWKELAEQHEFLGNDYLLQETNNAILRQQIALASLTAEPVGFTSQANIETLGKEGGKTMELMTSDASVYRTPVPLYTAPPVPVIQFPGYKRMDIPFAAHRIKHSGFNEAIDEIKRLNNLE